MRGAVCRRHECPRREAPARRPTAALPVLALLSPACPLLLCLRLRVPPCLLCWVPRSHCRTGPKLPRVYPALGTDKAGGECEVLQGPRGWSRAGLSFVPKALPGAAIRADEFCPGPLTGASQWSHVYGREMGPYWWCPGPLGPGLEVEEVGVPPGWHLWQSLVGSWGPCQCTCSPGPAWWSSGTCCDGGATDQVCGRVTVSRNGCVR